MKNILAENMRRFRTKNLNEDSSIFSMASEDNDGKWEEVFRNMKPSDVTANELFGWWLEVYSAMASRLLEYSKQINMGYKLTDFQTDIQQIMSATRVCVDKISLLQPDIYSKMLKHEKPLLNIIDRDLIKGLHKLIAINNQSTYVESNDIADKLKKIADKYQYISNALLELSWDYTDDEDEDGTNHNADIPTDNNIFNWHIKQTQKATPWLTTKITEWKPKRDELINKLNQGKTLYEIYNWLMETQGIEHGRFAYSHMSDAYMPIEYGVSWKDQSLPKLVPPDVMKAFFKAIGKESRY